MGFWPRSGTLGEGKAFYVEIVQTRSIWRGEPDEGSRPARFNHLTAWTRETVGLGMLFRSFFRLVALHIIIVEMHP
jgi:hypothetical protein